MKPIIEDLNGFSIYLQFDRQIVGIMYGTKIRINKKHETPAIYFKDPGFSESHVISFPTQEHANLCFNRILNILKSRSNLIDLSGFLLDEDTPCHNLEHTSK